ncbi:MAG: sugar-transfer associated ATP-grasp domain-containing protein [Patescibacteria group bacterium]
MDKFSDILTKNVRNRVFLKYNGLHGRWIANSKLRTKKILLKNEVSTPKLIAVLKTEKAVNNFAWEKLDGNFVVKPFAGSGGEGILVIRKRARWAGEWYLMNGDKVDISDLRFHCIDILQGQFNVRRTPDRILIEERVKIHPKFLSFTKLGTPDIRVIVFNRVPIMAMLRIPTKESDGKANISHGAIGLGIDLATGITTFGVQNDKLIKKIFDRKRKKMIKVNGIKIPFWDRVLETAVNSQQAVGELNYVGVDVLIDKEFGPMVLELNARPGLSIQICNRAGLRRRLIRVEGLKIRNATHGIRIAKALFGESFVDQVRPDREIKVLSPLEPIRIKTFLKSPKKTDLIAKVDTGAFRSSIDKKFAKQLGLLSKDNVLYYRHYSSALGKKHRRPVIAVEFWLSGVKITTAVNVTDRNRLRTKFLIGRKDLGGFVIRVEEIK